MTEAGSSCLKPVSSCCRPCLNQVPSRRGCSPIPSPQRFSPRSSQNPVASRLTLHVFDDFIQEVILLVHPHDEIACRTPSGGGHPLASCRGYCRGSSPKGKHSSGVLRKQHLVYTQEQCPFSRYRSPVRWVLFGLIGEWLQRISRHQNRSEMVSNQGLAMQISRPDQPLSSEPM